MKLELKPWVVDYLEKCKALGMFPEPWQLVERLEDKYGCTAVEAFASVFVDGEKLFAQHHDDWQSYAQFLQEHTDYSIPEIATHVSGWFGEQCESTVRRLLDPCPKRQAAQRQYDRDYWARLKTDPAKAEQYEARKARMREYSRASYRRKKQR